jgi:hypothetical protein
MRQPFTRTVKPSRHLQAAGNRNQPFMLTARFRKPCVRLFGHDGNNSLERINDEKD